MFVVRIAFFLPTLSVAIGRRLHICIRIRPSGGCCFFGRFPLLPFGFYWCNIISCSQMQTDLMWINRHSIIIGLQSSRARRRIQFQRCSLSLFYFEIHNFVIWNLVFLFSYYTHFFSPLSPFLLCVCTIHVSFDVFYYDFIGYRRHYDLNHM